MNPLDEKLNQAIEDFRDQTGHRMSTTRTHILARMRHQKMMRWSLGGGGLALLSLAAYFFMSTTTTPDQPLAEPPVPPSTTTQVSNGTPEGMNIENTLSTLSHSDSQKRTQQPDEASTTLTPEQADYVRTSADGSHDTFLAESTKVAQQAADAVASNDLVTAAHKYRGLAQLCESRAEWRRALTAYDSAVQYARQIGDPRMLASITKAQTSATKRASNKQ